MTLPNVLPMTCWFRVRPAATSPERGVSRRARVDSRWTIALVLSAVLTACGGGGSGGAAAPAPTYTIGGQVTMLTGAGLVLLNNGGNGLSVSAPGGSFTFTTPLASGVGYSITVQTQPAGVKLVQYRRAPELARSVA